MTATRDAQAPIPGPGARRLQKAYLDGFGSRAPVIPYDLAALEARARAAMPASNWSYLQSAGTGATYRANLAAIDDVRIAPAMLRGAANRDLGVTLLGRRHSSPLLLAPIGVQSLAHAEAERATARAAASRNVPFVFSSQSSTSMEDTAAEMADQPRWYQLYWSAAEPVARSLVERAEACGCEAIVITLDTTMLGWRPADLDPGFLPFLHGQGIAQYLSDPVFRSMLATPPEQDMMAAIELFTRIYANPGLDWETLRRIRDWTSLPVVLKGIQRADDARRAADEGWDGIVVSNHGGRQVDGAVGSMDQLSACVEAVGGRCPVLFDSGIRSGADVFKALALGASAVLLGRSYLWGLALAGEAGVAAVIDNVLAEFDLTLGLAGHADIHAIGTDSVVVHASPVRPRCEIG